MSSKVTFNRRRFLQRGAALAATIPIVGVPNMLSAREPNEKLGIAVIGCGGQGSGNPGLAASERLIALVDVDEKKLGEAVTKLGAKVPEPKMYHDYRKMFDECHKDIDAVLIATPDHHHAPAAIRAIQLGKHVFCEKPLTWCIYEARTLTTAARKHKVATQMGNQGHSGEGYRRLCEYIWAGAIGNVTETHSLMSRNFGGSGGQPPKKDVPAGLHWDEWLGPAQLREYHDGLHPFSWRSWCDFGTGSLGDMGCHVLDGAFWALKLAEAKQCTIECVAQTPGTKEMFARDNHIRWEFPARGDMPPVKVNSYDQQWPAQVKELEQKYGEKFNGGTLYIGDKGMMFTGTSGDNPRLLPKEKHDAFPKPEAKIPRSKHGVKGDFLAACKGDEPASSNFDVSGPFTEFVLSSVLANRTGVGKKIEWDFEKMRCTNIEEVNALVKRDYRKGWEV
jgi:predicted dehydrogenase